MPLSRRHLARTLGLAAVLMGSTALVACTSTGTPTVTPAAIIADVQSFVNGLAGALGQPAVVAAINAVPAAAAILPVVQKDLTLAQGALAGLASGVPATTGATIVQQIDGWINAVLTAADTPPLIGLIPSPFNLAVTAAAILLPGAEAFVNQYLPGGAAAASVHGAAHLRAASTMTADQARNELSRWK